MKIRTTFFDNIEVLTADNISAVHAFTTRRGGVSEGPFDSLNLGLYRGDKDENVIKNRNLLADALGFDLNKLVMTRQTHSDIVRPVTSKDALGHDHHLYPESDAIITNEPGVGLMVFAADCTPILLWDSVTGAVGAVHAGWRGTASAIAAKAVEKMAALYGCDPQNIHAAIGPNIGFCCFQTDADVPNAMLDTFGPEAGGFIRQQNDKYYVNLKELNALALRRVGVENITISDACTVCQKDRFWSHRVTKGIRGAQGAVIICP